MKILIKLFYLTFVSTIFLVSIASVPASLETSTFEAENIDPDSVVISYTGRIKAIIDAKCYECHSEKGKDDKAKEELMWDKLPKLGKMDQVYALDAIIESIEKNEMPPEEHVKKYPASKLTKEEATLLMKWADDLASKLYE